MYEKPVIEDYGSIVDHTFSRCNPSQASPGAAPIPNASGKPPVKGDAVNFHWDKFNECSGLSPNS